MQKLYNFGFSFPNVKAIIKSKKFAKIKADIKQNIIILILNETYFNRGDIRVAPVINCIKSNV
jgi:hypothetical protein